MVSVERYLVRPIWAAREDHAMVGVALFLCGAPSGVEIIFRSGSVEGWRPIIIVDKNHIITFPIPIPVSGKPQVMDIQVTTDKMPLARRLKDDVVISAGGVTAAVEELLIRQSLFWNAAAGILSAPLGMKPQKPG